MLLATESANSGLLFDLEKLDKDIEELTAQTEREDFWKNQNNARAVIAELNFKRDVVNTYRSLARRYEELVELLELGDKTAL